jgi:hypothetical protein
MSDCITQATDDIGARAGELLTAFRAHYHDGTGVDCDFRNTILALHGVNSMPGRVVSRTRHSVTRMHLSQDFRWVGESIERKFIGAGWRYEDNREVAPTSAASCMREHALRRPTLRLLKSTPETDAALLDYIDERMELLRRAEELFKIGCKAAARIHGIHEWTLAAAKERKAFEKLRAVLVSNRE